MPMELDARIRRLEQGGIVLVLVSLLVGLLLVLGSAADEKPLQVDRLEIVDAEGRVVAFLGTDEDGSTGLFLFDKEGRRRAAMVHDAEETGFFVSDPRGTIRLGAAHFAHGGSGFALHGEESKGGAVLYLKTSGSLTFYEGMGDVTLRLPEKKKP